MDSLIGWWDGFELWLVQLPYPLLVTLVLAVLLPVCWWLARVVDGGIDRIGARLTGSDAPDSALRTDDGSGSAS